MILTYIVCMDRSNGTECIGMEGAEARQAQVMRFMTLLPEEQAEDVPIRTILAI